MDFTTKIKGICMKKVIIFSIIIIAIIILAILTVNHYNNENMINQNEEIKPISDSLLYGFSDRRVIRCFERDRIGGNELYNFVDSNFFKNKNFYFAFREIERNYILIDSFWTYHAGLCRSGFFASFYADSNYLYYLLAILPKDSMKVDNRHENYSKQLFHSFTYKVIQSRRNISKMKELHQEVRKHQKYKSKDPQEDFYKKLDSLKAVLKR